MSWQPGQRVGDYRLERELGVGGMASVWLAEHLPTCSARALKRLSDTDPELRERFRREGEALARLSHPHVLGVHESFELGGDLVLATEVAEGGDLSTRIQAGPLELEAALDLTRDLASALEAAHARGILHRDLKPANVLFDEGGRPLLADFGLARLADRNSLTATGALLGTPAYLSPELAQGARADVRSDVYGLAAVLYACLAGRAPFERGNVIQSLRAAAEEPPPPLPDSIPSAVRAACLRGLAKAPEERFATPKALAAALVVATGHSPRRAWAPLGVTLATLACALVALACAHVLSQPESPTPSPLPRAAESRAAASPTASTPDWEPPPSGLTLGRRSPGLWVSVSWIDAQSFLLLRGDRYRRYRIGHSVEALSPWLGFPRELENTPTFSAASRMLHATRSGFFHGGWSEPPVFVPWAEKPQPLPTLPGLDSGQGVAKAAELPAGATTGRLWTSSRTSGVHRVDAYDLSKQAWTLQLETPGLTAGLWECHVLTGRSDGAICAIYRLQEDHRLLYWAPGGEVEVTKVGGLAERGAIWRGTDLWLCNRRAQIFRFAPDRGELIGGTLAASLLTTYPFGGVELKGIWFLPSGNVVTLGRKPLNLVEWSPEDYTPKRTLWHLQGVVASGARLSPDGRWALLGGDQGQAYLVSTSR